MIPAEARARIDESVAGPHGPPARFARSANVTPASSEIVASRICSQTSRSVQPTVDELLHLVQLQGFDDRYPSRQRYDELELWRGQTVWVRPRSEHVFATA